jgi:hypothetical protein
MSAATKVSRRFCLVCALALVLLTATGCGRSVSKAQADRVKLGMTPTDVEDILGKGKAIDPAETERLLKTSLPDQAGGPKVEIDPADLRGVRWGDDKKWVTVIYKNEKVFRVFTQGL